MDGFEKLLMDYTVATQNESKGVPDADIEALRLFGKLLDFRDAVKTYIEYDGTLRTSTEEKSYRESLKCIDEMTKEVE